MSFSKREWLFSIIIISLIQAFVWYSAFVNAGNGSALNFISFAGTLISIILAVLAIGYTYGESLSQKSHSDMVVNQISTLNQAIGNIKDQTEELEKIHEISESLSTFGRQVESRFEVTHKQVESISCAMQDLTTATSKHSLDSSAIAFLGNNKKFLIQGVCENRQPINEIGILATFLIDGMNKTLLMDEGIDPYLKIADEEIDDDRYKQSRSILVGSAFSCLSMLEAIGLITHITEGNKSLVKVDESFMKEFLGAVKESPAEAGKYYDAVRKAMISEFSM